MPDDVTIPVEGQTVMAEVSESVGTILVLDALSARRQDEAVARQGVINHQTTAHMLDLAFTRDFGEMSIPESYAVQGLQQASVPRDAVGTNLASQTPKT